MCDNWWPVSSHSMVLLLFNAIHFQRSFPSEVPTSGLMDVCVFAAGERWCAPSSTWSAMTLSNTWLDLTWRTGASTGSSTSAGTLCPRERWIAGKETGRCLSGGWFRRDRGFTKDASDLAFWIVFQRAGDPNLRVESDKERACRQGHNWTVCKIPH